MQYDNRYLKLSLAPVSLAKAFREERLGLEMYFDWCAEAGFDALDVPCPDRYPWFWRDFSCEGREVSRLLSERGLALGAFCCGNNFARGEATAFEAEVEAMQLSIRRAAAIGSPLLRIFGGTPEGPRLGGEEGMTVSRGLGRVVEALERCVPEAEKEGVVLALENHGRLPGYSWEMAAIVERFRSPALRCAFDVANFVASNMDEPEDPIRAYERLRPYIAYVHVKDFGPPVFDTTRRVEPVLMGQGEVPLHQLMERIVSGGYTGLFAIEYEAARRVPEREGVLANVAYFREMEAGLQALGVLPRGGREV